MDNLNLFAPIQKVEEQEDGTIKVWGVASTPSRDTQGEIVKTEAIEAALPDYLKFANIREMHQPIAAGTAIEAAIKDGGLHLGAHVVDEGSVKKVKTGVLKGFSIGGKYLDRDPADKSIVTALKLTEISLVDRPANPDCLISMWKAEGAEKREFSDKERSKLAEEGAAMPDGSFPIKTKDDLENAVKAIGRAKDKEAAQKHITARAKALDATDLLPADWPGSTKKEKAMRLGNLIKGAGAVLAKYAGEEINDALAALNAASTLYWLASKEAAEGDHPEAPAQLEALKNAIAALKAFVISELGEDTLLEQGGGEPMYLMAKAGARHSSADLEKVQGIHDHSVALGAACKGAEKSEVIEMEKQEVEQLIEARLGKVETAHQEAMAKLETAHKEAMAKKDEEITGLKTEIEAIKANTPKGGGPALKIVTKGEDFGKDDAAAQVEPVKKADGTIDQEATALAMTKAAMQNPVILQR